MSEVSRQPKAVRKDDLKKRHSSVLHSHKLKHFSTLSYAVVSGIEGLINAPSGYRDEVDEQFEELRVPRIRLQSRLDGLKEMQNLLALDGDAAALKPHKRYQGMVRWGHYVRDLLGEVEEYLADLYKGIKEVHFLQKGFNTSADAGGSLATAGASDSDEISDASLDPEILAQVDRKRGMARSFSYAELTTLRQLATCISDSFDCYPLSRPFNPIEVAASTAFTFFYQDITLAETDYNTNGSRPALRDFLLMSQGLLNVMVDIADQQRLIDKNRILFNHTQSAEAVLQEIINAKTDAALKADRESITLSISGIPQLAFHHEQFAQACELLRDLAKQFNALEVFRPELDIDAADGRITLKIPVKKAQESETVRPEAIERLLALEMPPAFIEPEIEVPWRKGSITIKCQTKSRVLCDPFGREVLSYVMDGVTDLFECSVLSPQRCELFFDKRAGPGTELNLLRARAYGVRVAAGSEDEVLYSSYQCSRTDLCEPTFIPEGSIVEIGPGIFHDDNLKGALGGLMATATRVHVSGLTSENFIEDSDANRKALASTIVATTRVIDGLKGRGESKNKPELCDPIVLIKPIDVLDPTFALYTVQIFGSDGRELHRFKRCNDESAIRSIHVDRRLWREAYTSADAIVRKLTRGCQVEAPEEVMREFNKSGFGPCSAFTEELARQIREGDPLNYLASVFLDPHWIVKRDLHAGKMFDKPLCIAMGWRGDRACYIHDGMVF